MSSILSRFVEDTFVVDQQKRTLDKLMDEKNNKIHNDQYNKIHEDAFNKIAGLDGKLSLTSRMRDVIQRLWFDKNRHLRIIRGLEKQIKDALSTCEIQQKQIQALAAEVKKMRGSKGNYGQA
jgi:hypothetical protein